MAESRITISLEQKNAYNTQMEKAGASLNQYTSDKNYKPTPENEKRVGEVKSQINTIKQFASQTELTTRQFRELRQTVQKLYQNLYALNTGLLNKKGTGELQTKLGKAQGQLEPYVAEKNVRRDAINKLNNEQFQGTFSGLKFTNNQNKKQLTQISSISKALANEDKLSNYSITDANGKTYNAAEYQFNKEQQDWINQRRAIDAGSTDANATDVEKLTSTELQAKIDEVTIDIRAIRDKLLSSGAPVGPNGKPTREAQNVINNAANLQAQENETNALNERVLSTHETQEANKANAEYNATLNQQNGIMKTGIARFLSFRLVLGAARMVLRSVTNTIKELDKNLTEQAMVTGKSRQETYQLLSTYQELGKQLGTTTKEVSSVATQYIRQGKTVKEALTLTEAAVSAAKVAGISATESVNYLTTALNGFQLSASEAMSVSDKFAAIAANSATSYEEIATALSKVASQANLAGMSIDYTTALLAKGIETTREAPETIGTALKTVIARMREMSDYGETLEGDTDVNNVETQLAYVGIALKNQAGELRSTEDVLDELGKKWDSLNKNQQAAIAKALAGTRQQSRLIAMMTDYERVTELQRISLRSEGATMAQMSTYMSGMAAATNKLSVAWEGFISKVLDTDELIDLVDWLAGAVEGITENAETYTKILGTILTLLGLILGVRLVGTIVSKAKIVLEQKITAEKIKQIAAQIFLNQAEKEGVALATAASGLIGAILAAITLLIVAIIVVVNGFKNMKDEVEQATEATSELSAEIYKLNTVSTAIDTAITKFEKLDEQLIKTKQDAEDMATALDTASDKLSTDEDENILSNLGMSEKDYYDTLSTNAQKVAFLKRVQEAYNKQINQDRADTLKIANSLSGSNLQEYLQEETNIDAIMAINNAALYDRVDALQELENLTDDESEAIEELTQELLENVDAYTALEYANNPDKINDIIKSLKGLNTVIDDENYSWAEVLSSDSFTLTQQVEAYEQIESALQGQTDMLESLQSVYSSYKIFSEMDDDVVQLFEDMGYTAETINDVYGSYQELVDAGIDITEDQFHDKFFEYFQALSDFQGDVTKATEKVFGDLIASADDYADAWNAVITTMNDAVTVSTLDMGQNILKYKNTIDDFYAKSLKWKDMTDQEKTEFIADNADYFQGADGDKLLKAFETGNFNEIQKAISSNEAIQDTREARLKEVKKTLEYETSLTEDEQDKAYIEELKAYKEFLEDETEAYRASLETRLTREENELSTYKEILEREKEALEDSLNDRKDAYEKYFDAINEEADDSDYEEEVNLMLTNLSKLGSSTNADARKQAKEISDSLKDKEEERLQDLRERAQEAVTQDIDDQLSEINDQFEKLTENNAAMLKELQKLNTGNLITEALSGALYSGMTENELTDYIDTLNANLGTIIDKDITDQINFSTDSNNNIVLNVDGQSYSLTDDNKDYLWNVVRNALTTIGVTATTR